jgi:hypothetical protein
MPEPPSSRSRTKSTSTLPTQIILGENTCDKIWLDVRDTVLPSWVGRLPTKVGNHKHKKLGADQWRVFVTVHLVITLVPLWTRKGGLFLQLLKNFMDLVKAVQLATSRWVSPGLIVEYESTYQAYLNDMCRLFPQATITPTQHAATHFGSFMRDFGPSHDYNCFPFERMNHHCQKVNTNRKAGKPL